MRIDVEFDGHGGVALRGWLYVPEASTDAVPGVVMAHGLSGVKEQGLDRYAEVFCEAGLVVLVYDHRNFGASDGEPRQLLNPWAQARDYRRAIGWLAERPEVDADRLAVWGTSYSGGQVVVLGAVDQRVKAVVSNVPFTGYPGVDYESALGSFDAIREELFDESGRGLADKGEVMGPITLLGEPGSDQEAFFGEGDASDLFLRTDESGASSWQNFINVQNAVGGDPAWDPGYSFSHLMVPLLMVVASQDTVASADLALASFERSPEPKLLHIVDCMHFAAYDGEYFESASVVMREFLLDHLTH
jgi:fermentation-respiration switch protein FrsA (DUF1100 family)